MTMIVHINVPAMIAETKLSITFVPITLVVTVVSTKLAGTLKIFLEEGVGL